MLTLESILKTTRQMTAYGEGPHQFGGPEPRNAGMQKRIAEERTLKAEEEIQPEAADE